MKTFEEHFEFHKYKECFARFFELREDGVEDLRLIISTHPYSSGYWIENTGKTVKSKYDFIYEGQQVDDLVGRVEKWIEECKRLDVPVGGVIL